jgi:GAF domain-containing protein
VVSAVERVLKQVRLRREREGLANQLTETNQELQQRVKELTTILAIGKAVTSITDQCPLLEKIMEGAVFVTEADGGWLLLRQGNTNTFILSALRNLPQEISDKLNQPWDDGISALVNLSGESLAITGEPLKRFKLSRIWQSALVVPIKVKDEVMGILVVVRKAAQPFSQGSQALVEAVADYASIALVNIRLVLTLEERVQTLKRTVENARLNEKKKEQVFARIQNQVNAPLVEALDSVSALLLEEEGKLKPKPKNLLRTAQDKLLQATRVLKESD